MHQPRFEPRFAKGTPDRLVIGARHFDANDQVGELMLFTGLAQLTDSQFELHALVLDRCRRDEHSAIEVGQHPLRTGLGAIDGDDAEALGPNFLDARLDYAARFAEHGLPESAGSTPRAFFARLDGCNHSNGLLVVKRIVKHFPQRQLEWFF
jgi:hypothetical protein